MDYQVLFNIALGAFGVLAMFLITNVNKKIDRLAEEDKEMMLKVSALQILVAGHYVTRAEFDVKVDAFFVKLDSIDDKLERRSNRA